MNRIERAITKLKQSSKELNETLCVLRIDMAGQNIKVHVYTLRDLEQVPGKVKITDEGNEYEYPIRHVKFYNGVEFFCLTQRDEHREAV